MSGKLACMIKSSQDDIDFWTYQIAQHALFLSKLLDRDYVPKLQHEAHELYKKFYCMIQQPVITYDSKLLTSMYALLFSISSRTHKEFGLTKELSDEDFRTLIQHMIIEQTYFVRLVEGNMTIEEELLFWSKENSQHTKIVSHLLPPGDLKDRLSVMADSIRENNLLSQMDPMYFDEELGLIEQSNHLSSIIHMDVINGDLLSVNKDMLEHEMREASRGETRIKSLIELLKKE